MYAASDVENFKSTSRDGLLKTENDWRKEGKNPKKKETRLLFTLPGYYVFSFNLFNK